MSITFMPADNCRYCDENKLTGETVYDCQCVDFPEMFSEAKPCRECDGKGKVRFPCYPFEANLANGNAYAVMNMLRMPADYSGECNPQIVLDGIAFVRAMNAVGHEPLVTAPSEERGEGGCRVVHCGREPDQIERYMVAFKGIAIEAARRKVNVVWG